MPQVRQLRIAGVVLAVASMLGACGGGAGNGGAGGGAGTSSGAGTTGAAGTSSGAGTSGAGGTTGAAGMLGAAGTMAVGGTMGANAGTMGAAGTTGANAGATGAAGTTGANAGTTGSGGRGGSTAAGGGGSTGAGGGGRTGAGGGVGSWELLAPMALGARQEFQVAALKGLVYAVGAFGTSASSRRLEAYDPTTNTWSTKADIPFASDHPNVATTADKLYILGEVGAQQSAEYDPVANAWTMRAPIPTQRAASATAAIGTKVYVAGGAMGSNGASFGPTVRDFAAFDTVTNTWETLAELPTPGRNHAVGAAVGGIFYIVGGRTNGPTDGLQSRMDAYDPVAKTWTAKAPMPVARGGCMGGVVNGLIIVVGGEGNAPEINPNRVFPDNNGYDPATNTWRVFAPMRTPRHGTGAAGLDGKLYVPGGATALGGSGTTAILEAFTPP